MSDNDIDVSSVNWEYGMLITPDHFLRQERYFDSMLLWVLRYGTDAYGLVGAGARSDVAERGAAKHDPRIDIHNDEETIKISVSQCRGISPAGDIIEIDPARPVNRSFSKKELEGHNELGIYIVCDTHDKVVDDALDDPANPQVKSSRRPNYRIELDITGAQASRCLTLGRIRKQPDTLRYEKVRGFIPMCTTLVSHSELRRAWEKLSGELSHLADRYTKLHKAIVEYISMANDRDINTRADAETLQFVGRMVTTLENSAYALLDPLQSPQRFFQQLYRVIRSAAIYLDLSPPTRTYFEQLAEGGETEFGSLLEEERQTLLTNRELSIHDNLNVDEQRLSAALYRLNRLEEALEGKYLDFRVSTSLEALNFYFDRNFDPPALFRSLAKPSRAQTFAKVFTFVFAPLSLAGRQRYRLVLIGSPDAQFDRRTVLNAEIRLNEGTGQNLPPIYGKANYEMEGQRNFAIEFDAPSTVQTISDVRVNINADSAIKSCLLYGRRYLQGHIQINNAEPLASSAKPSFVKEPVEPPPPVQRPRPSRLTRTDEIENEPVADWKQPRRRLE